MRSAVYWRVGVYADAGRAERESVLVRGALERFKAVFVQARELVATLPKDFWLPEIHSRAGNMTAFAVLKSSCVDRILLHSRRVCGNADIAELCSFPPAQHSLGGSAGLGDVPKGQ